MTDEEAKKKIEKIYDEAMEKLRVIEIEQKRIIADFFKKMEEEKIEAIKKRLNI